MSHIGSVVVSSQSSFHLSLLSDRFFQLIQWTAFVWDKTNHSLNASWLLYPTWILVAVLFCNKLNSKSTMTGMWSVVLLVMPRNLAASLGRVLYFCIDDKLETGKKPRVYIALMAMSLICGSCVKKRWMQGLSNDAHTKHGPWHQQIFLCQFWLLQLLRMIRPYCSLFFFKFI